jgi:hypothetical protein
MKHSDIDGFDYCETTPGKWVKVVRAMIGGLEFGEVQLLVHRGHVTEVRKIEKIRLDPPPAPPPQEEAGPA